MQMAVYSSHSAVGTVVMVAAPTTSRMIPGYVLRLPSPGCHRGLIFGLIRMRSSTFIRVRINAAKQVTDVRIIR